MYTHTSTRTRTKTQRKKKHNHARAQLSTHIQDAMVVRSYTKGLLSVCLLVVANYASQTLGYSTRRFLERSMLVKYALVFVFIYCTLRLFAPAGADEERAGGDEERAGALEAPHQLGVSVVLWIFFVLFTRMGARFTAAVSCMLLGTFVLSEFRPYFGERGHAAVAKYVGVAHTALAYAIVATVLLGFALNVRRHRRELGARFSLYGFMLSDAPDGAATRIAPAGPASPPLAAAGA